MKNLDAFRAVVIFIVFAENHDEIIKTLTQISFSFINSHKK